MKLRRRGHFDDDAVWWQQGSMTTLFGDNAVYCFGSPSASRGLTRPEVERPMGPFLTIRAVARRLTSHPARGQFYLSPASQRDVLRHRLVGQHHETKAHRAIARARACAFYDRKDFK